MELVCIGIAVSLVLGSVWAINARFPDEPIPPAGWQPHRNMDVINDVPAWGECPPEWKEYEWRKLGE